jgi:hypothetical protein
MNIGDRIKDNDPRMPNRVLVIVKFESGYVVTSNRDGRTIRVRKDRIHRDGKERRSGFTLMEPQA